MVFGFGDFGLLCGSSVRPVLGSLLISVFCDFGDFD